MYIDFKINENGDLDFAEQSRNNSNLKVSFFLANTTLQKISFNIDSNKEEMIKNGLKISFEIKNYKPNKVCKTLLGDQALAQLIIIRLKTTLNSIPDRENVGSKLVSFRHLNINSDTLTALEKYLEGNLKDLLYNPKVEAIPIIIYKNGYKQTVKLNIYDSMNKITEHIIER